MDLRYHNGCLKVFLTDKNKRIPPEQWGVYATTGYGKSLCEEGIVEAYFNAGFIVIYLGDGMKGEEEGAYAMFEPEEKYHLALLKKEGKHPRKVEVKLYHPFTFNIPSNSIPDYNFFTIPIKNLGRRDFSMLAETQADSDTIRILLQASQNLSKEGGIYQLLHDIQTLIKGKRKDDSVSPSQNNFYLTVSSGTAKSMQDISNLFQAFKKDYFLVKENCDYTLDMKKILSDNKSIHFFSTKYLRDPKIKEFILLVVLNKILENKDYAKHPVCIVIPEIRRLCPDKAIGYQKFLSEAIKEALSTMRSQGQGGFASILSSQSWNDTEQGVRDSHSITLLGKLNINDIDKISKVLGYNRERRLELANPPSQNSWLQIGREGLDWWHYFTPSWCHAEPEYKFEEMFKKYYPEKMKKYSELINTLKTLLNEEEAKFKDKAKREEEEERKRYEQKKKEREQRIGNNQVQDVRQKEREFKEQGKLKDMERAQRMREEGLTLIDIANKLGTSKDSVRRWLLRYELIKKTQEPELSNTPTEDKS